jgi:glutamine synthetase type III
MAKIRAKKHARQMLIDWRQEIKFEKTGELTEEEVDDRLEFRAYA